VAILSLFLAQRDALLAIVDGHLEDAPALIRRFVECADDSGAPVRGRQYGVLMLIDPALYLGRADILLAALDEYGGPASLAQPGRPAAFFIRLTAARAMCLAQLGHVAEARTVAGPLLDELEESIDDELPMGPLVHLLEAAVVLGHKRAAGAVAARLACVSHLAGESTVYTCIARHLGDAAALVGEPAAARAYYAQALESAGKVRFRPELALAHLRLAELLFEEAEDATRSEALMHLDLAIPELEDMHMQPGLERARVLSDAHLPVSEKRRARSSASDTLTAREREIASLVASGLSNREIADRLVISEGTVEVHVKHILGKLDFKSRSQVAIWFERQGVEGADNSRR
jgi:DNA-binding CsgD family transcriptional regulator